MDKSIGILGGGQLAMMLTEAAMRMGVGKVTVLDPAGDDCPARRAGAAVVKGDFRDAGAVREFCESGGFDVVTVDIESVAVDGLDDVGVPVYPDVECLRVVQDKLEQRRYVSDIERLKQPRFWSVSDFPFYKWKEGGKFEGRKFVVKSRREGYDGKGVWFMTSGDEFRDLVIASGGDSDKFYIEEYIELAGEYSVLVYRSHSSDNLSIGTYPVLHTVQEGGICKEVIFPSGLSDSNAAKMRKWAVDICMGFGTSGVMAMEMFLGVDGEVYLNEISPRVHNSGHLTIEAGSVSQFDQHIRCILGMKTGNSWFNFGIGGSGRGIKMENVLARGVGMSVLDEHALALNRAHEMVGVLHWYGKKGNSEGEGKYKMLRKIGHITYRFDVRRVVPQIYIVMGSKSDLSVMRGAVDLLGELGVECAVDVVSAHRSPEWMMEFGREVKERGGRVVIAAAGGAAHLPGMLAAVTDLPVIGVPVATKHLGGQDSLYSIVEMPDGVPVATVGIGKSRNAAILALKICGMWDAVGVLKERNLDKVESQREEMKREGLGLGWGETMRKFNYTA